MKEGMRRRVVTHGLMVAGQRLTLREVAKRTGYSKCTVHIDVTERLQKTHMHNLAQEVRKVLDHHKNVRAHRGGESTKRYWEERRHHRVAT